MAKVITENFRVETANELFNSFKSLNSSLGENFLTQLQSYDDGLDGSGFNLSTQNELAIKKLVDDQLTILRPEADYYIMASSWLNPAEDIDTIGRIKNTQRHKRDFQRRVIFGNKINSDTARYMFYENAWSQGTVYDSFDDTVDAEDLNNVVTVRNSQGEFIVFKCIENNNGQPSLVSPQSIANQFIASNYQSLETEDKYIWHYMFTVTSDEAEKYKTSDSLPLPVTYGDANVIASAEENISQIVIESTPAGQFNQYLFGEATSSANASDVLISSTTQVGDFLSVTLNITNKIGRSLYNDLDSYKYMYLRSNQGSTQGKLYDVVSSSSDNATKQITVVLRTTDVLVGVAQLVIKVEVSSSTLTGERCKSYGVLNQFGTLERICFEKKGTEYKYATAKVVYPKSLSTPGATVLRAVVSPKGGHGFNPVNELSMSRLSIVTNFSGEVETIPDSNTYSQVGLIKNPKFKDASGNIVTPESFDNRVSLNISSQEAFLSSSVNKVVEQHIRRIDVRNILGNHQYIISELGDLESLDWQALGATTVAVGESFTSVANPSPSLDKSGVISFAVDSLTTDGDEETITGIVHSYDGTVTPGIMKVVSYYGDFESKFHAGNIKIKDSIDSTTGSTVNINSFSDISYGQYSPYTGELLHFIDFSPITREATTREKIKFTFDF